MQRFGTGVQGMRSRILSDASCWHSLKQRLNSKVRRFVSFSLSAVLAAGTLIGVATPAHAADYMRGYSNIETRAVSNATILYTTFTYKNQLLFLTRVNSNNALVVAKPDGTTTTLLGRVG